MDKKINVAYDTERHKDKNSTIQNISFEDALNELEKITALLEKGQIGLEQAVHYYRKAKKLHGYCREKLEAVKLEVEEVIHEDGELKGVKKSTLQNDYEENGLVF